MKITVVAAILKDDNLTLVTDKGEYHKLPQGDHRIRPILDRVLPEVSVGRSVEVDLTPPEMSNSYEDFEKKTNGVVRFFRVAKNTLKKWFGAESLSASVADGTYGSIPDNTKSEDKKVAEILSNPEVRQQTLAEMIAEAEPVKGMVFNTETHAPVLEEGETMIAVVDNKTIIPNTQHLQAQVARSNTLGDSTAMENFMRRAGAIPRLHSLEDLIQFISKLDTPVTQNGFILAYKNLNHMEGEVYVDPYTKKVRQGVGTHVCMDAKLVDPNRGQDCSNGLHVASRSYLRGYSGDACFLILIDPSDVIAVPKYNTNKMRVRAYSIIGKLSAEDRQAVLNNQPMHTEDGKRLLAAAIAGKHVPITSQTEITGSYGGGCIYTALNSEGQVVADTAVFEEDTLEDLGMVEPLDSEAPGKAPTVEVNEVASQVEQVIAQVAGTRKEQAKALYDDWVWQYENDTDDVDKAKNALLDFKKSCKTSWKTLGLPHSDDGKEVLLPTAEIVPEEPEAQLDLDEVVDDLNGFYTEWLENESGSKEEYDAAKAFINLWNKSGLDFIEEYEEELSMLMADEDDLATFKAVIHIYETDHIMEALVPTPKAEEGATAPTPAAKEPSYRERIRALLNQGPLTIGIAKDIMALKKTAKKGWSALGVTADEAMDIEEQAKTD